jgi:hypothetical protein
MSLASFVVAALAAARAGAVVALGVTASVIYADRLP